MNEPGRRPPAGPRQVLHLYDRGLPQVYGYLMGRCNDMHLAEELTGETFLAAVETAHRRPDAPLSVGWLVTVARNKLADHWRRQEREHRRLRRLTGEELVRGAEEWDAPADAGRADEVLASLRGPYRAVLTLRYVDGLPVAEVAEIIDRTPHATEALIVRARLAFRRLYEQGEEGEEVDA